MDFDVKRYLIDEVGFSAEDAEGIAAKFTPDRAEKLAGSYVPPAQRAQYADIEKQRAALANAETNLNAEIEAWSKMTAEEQANNKAMRDELEKSRVRAYELEQKLMRTATDAGLDPKAILGGEPAAPPKREEPVQPAVDMKNYVGREQFGQIMDFTLELPAILDDIRDQHRELTGQRLDTREIVREMKARIEKKDPNADPVKIWEEKFNIPAKRAEVAAAEDKKRIEAAEARGYERARTEQAVPTPGLPGRSAPVFRVGQHDGQPRQSLLKRPAPESIARSAASALASGKYRTGGAR